MRISQERQDARIRISELQLKILKAMEQIDCSEVEFNLAVGELKLRWNNEKLAKRYPIPED